MNNYDGLWDEILKNLEQPEVKQPHEKTLREMAMETKLSERTLRRKLDMLVLDGKLTCRLAIAERGRKCLVYSPVIAKDKTDLDQDEKHENS